MIDRSFPIFITVLSAIIMGGAALVTRGKEVYLWYPLGILWGVGIAIILIAWFDYYDRRGRL